MIANKSSMSDTSPVGFAIAEIRRKKGLKLAGVSRYVPVSTLSAIERGRIIPSTPMLDAITVGLGLSVGDLDLLYLESVRDVSQRREVYLRLLTRGAPLADVQRSLFRALSVNAIPKQRPHLQHLLAEVLASRGCLKRSIVILEHARLHRNGLNGEMQVDILSLLGKNYLKLNRPEVALGPLLEAVRLRFLRRSWESAMCNLGLAWWALGRYEQARTQWERAVESVTNTELRANALMGLGSVALGARRADIAAQYFCRALAAYDQTDAVTEVRAQAVNNLLVSALQGSKHDSANGAYETTRQLAAVVKDSLVRGQLLESMAEWADVQGNTALAEHLLQEAKDLLGDSPVVSWFSARFLELRSGSKTCGPAVGEVFQDMEDMIARLHDPQVITAIRLRMAQVAVRGQDLQSAESILDACIRMFPPLGHL